MQELLLEFLDHQLSWIRLGGTTQLTYSWGISQLPTVLRDLIIGSTPMLGGKHVREVEIATWINETIVQLLLHRQRA